MADKKDGQVSGEYNIDFEGQEESDGGAESKQPSGNDLNAQGGGGSFGSSGNNGGSGHSSDGSDAPSSSDQSGASSQPQQDATSNEDTSSSENMKNDLNQDNEDNQDVDVNDNNQQDATSNEDSNTSESNDSELDDEDSESEEDDTSEDSDDDDSEDSDDTSDSESEDDSDSNEDNDDESDSENDNNNDDESPESSMPKREDMDNDESDNDLSSGFNPDADSLKGRDVTEHWNPDMDAEKGDDTTEDSNPDDDAKKESDSTDDSNPDDDSKKGDDSTDDSNPDDDSKKEEDPSGSDDEESEEEQDSDSKEKDSKDEAVDKGAKAMGMGSEKNKLDRMKSLGNSIKNAKGMSKEDLKNHAKEAAVDNAKTAVKATIAPYIIPIIATIAIVLGVVFLTLIMTMGFYAINDNAKEQNGGKGCSASDKADAEASANVTASKDEAKNAKKIMQYIVDNTDYNVKQAAGIVGAFSQESQMNPKATNDSSGAYGIAQWLGGRLDNLEKVAKEEKKDKSDLGVQLKYLVKEIKGSEKQSLEGVNFKDKKTPEDAAKAWSIGFERMGNDEANFENREASAKKWYSKFGDQIKTDGKKDKDDDDSDSNVSDSSDAGDDNSDACGGDDKKTDGKMGSSVKPNGGSGKRLKLWQKKEDIPKKYRKHIELPDFSVKELDKVSHFNDFGSRGQCVELTYGYMRQLWKGGDSTPSDGDGIDLVDRYEEAGAKTTFNPTVGYGFSSAKGIAGSGDNESPGHTGVVIGVMKDGKYLVANYNADGEANKDRYTRNLTFLLIDGQPKSGDKYARAKFFSGPGNKPKIKVDKKDK